VQAQHVSYACQVAVHWPSLQQSSALAPRKHFPFCDKSSVRRRTSLLCIITELIIATEFGKVVLEDSHENGDEDAEQQQNEDAGVDDGEPVDLEMLWQEALNGVLVHARVKLKACGCSSVYTDACSMHFKRRC
jgi:hypothetical protein